MDPVTATEKQIERYRQMSGEQRLRIALDLHEMSCNIAREGIRCRYPNASTEFVEAKLRERIRVGYQISEGST